MNYVSVAGFKRTTYLFVVCLANNLSDPESPAQLSNKSIFSFLVVEELRTMYLLTE